MANIGNKYRVHEVAKDFGLPTKQITEILTEYAQTPKNHMQVLEDHELSLIFEYLTQHNPVSGIQVIFAEGMKPAAEKKAEPAPEKKAEPKKEAAKGTAAPKAEPAQKKAEAKPAQPVSRVPKTKVVDTSKATNINLAKYDEKLQDMADARSHGRRDQQQTQGKEKFRNSKQRRDNNFVSNKRKQEEADRRQMLADMDCFSDLLTRENATAHFTASCWIVNPDRTKVLMAYHNLYRSWAWLGGHADGEEDLLAVALREVREESGVKHARPASENIFSLEVLTVDGHEKRGAYVSSHLHLNVTYLLIADDSDALTVKPDENSGVRWFTPEGAIEASSEPWFRERIYKKLNAKLAALR